MVGRLQDRKCLSRVQRRATTSEVEPARFLFVVNLRFLCLRFMFFCLYTICLKESSCTTLRSVPNDLEGATIWSDSDPLGNLFS